MCLDFKIDGKDPFRTKLEINGCGAEKKTLWNIEWFENYSASREGSDADILQQNHILESGDIVYITNKHSGAFLTIEEKNINNMIQLKYTLHNPSIQYRNLLK